MEVVYNYLPFWCGLYKPEDNKPKANTWQEHTSIYVNDLAHSQTFKLFDHNEIWMI